MEKAETKEIIDKFYDRYSCYAFHSELSKQPDQRTYKAVMRRLVHIIEKGLSMNEYQFGRGKDAVLDLEEVMLNYFSTYGVTYPFCQTAMCVLDEYIQRNKNCHGQIVDVISKYNDLMSMGGTKNERAGILQRWASEDVDCSQCNFEEMLTNRHSVRHFSEKPVEEGKIIEAIELAKYTPSACNRQGWKTYIIFDEEKKQGILANQNGNKGFGDKIKVLLVIAYDLRFTSADREVFQGFIDGGMYLMSLLYALQYGNLASVPLSGSLHPWQEARIRKMLDMDESEILIGFVGVGNFAEEYKVAKSFRDAPDYVIV